MSYPETSTSYSNGCDSWIETTPLPITDEERETSTHGNWLLSADAIAYEQAAPSMAAVAGPLFEAHAESGLTTFEA